MKIKRIIILICTMIILFTSSLPIILAEDTKARVEFVASEPDANGYFTLTMSVANAKFNAFQFVLRYNKNSLQPIDQSTLQATDSFFRFAEIPESNDWMSTIGTEIDPSLGLIDFTGYVSPGNYVAVDAAKIDNAANIGAAGLILFEFHFQRINAEPVMIEIAKAETNKASRMNFPEGSALVYGGTSLAAAISITLPPSLGQSTTIDTSDFPVEEVANVNENQNPNPDAGSAQNTGEIRPATVAERLKDTLILQIGNYAAASNGVLCHIYPGEKAVTPYIKDSRTFIPIRFVAEKLGMTVEWNANYRTVSFYKDGKVLCMTIGALEFTIDNVAYSMDTVAEITMDRTMVPIRFVAQALGHAVEWNPESQMIYITRNELPWDFSNEVEKQATSDVSLILSPLLRDFV
ncbi:MAG: copper amine oxidase N-terminal domain-containing protein [Negativicutes bacterium]|nr:copper amine oxidase N-terminal domain-containing protein [Negativicutes bacterium]